MFIPKIITFITSPKHLKKVSVWSSKRWWKFRLEDSSAIYFCFTGSVTPLTPGIDVTVCCLIAAVTTWPTCQQRLGKSTLLVSKSSHQSSRCFPYDLVSVSSLWMPLSCAPSTSPLHPMILFHQAHQNHSTRFFSFQHHQYLDFRGDWFLLLGAAAPSMT